MRRPIIFLNEVSLTADRELAPQELLPHVLATLKVARDAKRLRRELIVVGGLVEVAFGAGFHSLSSLLRGADYREEWRSLKGLEQSSPYDQDEWLEPSDLEEVRVQEVPGVGLLRALENKSAILSFAFREVWESPYVLAVHARLDEVECVICREVEIPNLATPEHVTEHEMLIQELGTDLSASSIIYECDDFVLRIYFNDHNPPHFHVMTQQNPSETLARFRISNLDQLTQSGRLRPGLRRKVIEWAGSRQDALLQCWNQCSQYRHPARLE
ncbi:MAG: DUF4160 domain-containing protein [Bryobacteraceae bacterium]|nr:DUF4160 domain-containing protein [Bryobacteraceae bacterium]